MKRRIFQPARLGAILLAATVLAPCIAAAQSGGLKLVKGTVLSTTTGQAADGGRVLVYQGSSTETVTTSKINPGTGFYQVILNPGIEYRFEVASPKFYRTSFTVKTPAGTTYEETVKDLKVAPIPMGITLYSGHAFDPGSTKLNDDAKLNNLVTVLKKENSVVVTVSLIPDMSASTAKKPAAKKPKKGKPVEQVADVPTVGFQEIAEGRMTAIKNLFKQNSISTTRLTWDVKPGVTVSGKKGAKVADNMIVKITSIKAGQEADS